MLEGINEPKETHLGYSKKWDGGKSVGTELGNNIYLALSNSEAARQGSLTYLEETALFINNINRDRISDIVTSLIKPLLIRFTGSICVELEVPTELTEGILYWDFNQKQWEIDNFRLPHISYGDSDRTYPKILIPTLYICRDQIYSSDAFYNDIYLYARFGLANNYDIRENFARLLRDVNNSDVTKEQLRQMFPIDPIRKKEDFFELVNEFPNLLDYFALSRRQDTGLFDANRIRNRLTAKENLLRTEFGDDYLNSM